MNRYLKSDPVNENGTPIRGYRKRLFKVWQEIGPFEPTEHRVCDQARAIRKNGWLSEIEIELIQRQIEKENCITGAEHNSIVENVNTTGNIECAHGSMQERDLATENDAVRLVNFDKAEVLSVEDEMLVSDILQIFRSDEKYMIILKQQINSN